MSFPRIAFAAALTACLAGPVVLVVLETVRSPGGWSALADVDRIAGLAENSLALCTLTVLIAVPLGTFAAVALERAEIAGRPLIDGLVLVGMFLPLPVYAVAWQVVLGTWLPPLGMQPGQVAWRPWSQGLLPAAWVHGMAGLPWVVWIVRAGLRTTDRGLEEDALLTGGPGEVLRRVLLPRAALSAMAATGWIVSQVGTEITVTDAMMVRTFAEEVYTQFVGASDGLAGAVAVTVLAWVLSVFVGGVVIRWMARAYGAIPADSGPSVELRFGRFTRVAASAALWAGVAAFAGLPLAALVWKAGSGGTQVGWGVEYLAATLTKVVRSDGGVLAGSIGTTAATGAITVALAWPACWLACRSRWFARFLFVLCVVLWATPGPLVGLGLKEAINLVVDLEARVFDGSDSHVVFRPLLYDTPSPVPAVWASVIRLFPVAVAVLWPAVRAIPRDLIDAAKLDGLTARGEWTHIVIPFTGVAAAHAGIAVAALALGEVSASKLVNPPGRTAYVLRLFDEMHYGAESTVAALALLQTLAAVLPVVLIAQSLSKAKGAR